MGSSGMKRKGRRHLPKVGTGPSNERLNHDRQTEALHPFSGEPSRRSNAGYGIAGVLVVLLVTIGIVALIVAT
jgi:hypothetical protein